MNRKSPPIFRAFLTWRFCFLFCACLAARLHADGGESATLPKIAERRLLYVAAFGIRDYLEYGGHGILVFDIDHGHQFVKRIPSARLDEKGKPLNV